jgi:hypothetical protein
MENREKTWEASTLLDMRTPEARSGQIKREECHTSAPIEVDSVRMRRSSARGKLLLFLSALGLGAAGGSLGTYEMMKYREVPPQSSQISPRASVAASQTAVVQKPFFVVKSDAAPAVSSRSDTNEVEVPSGHDEVVNPDTPDKLAKALADAGIKAVAEDFKTNNQFLNAVILLGERDEAGVVRNTKWASLSARTNIADEDVLVAIKFGQPMIPVKDADKSTYRNLLRFVGRQPVSYVDDSNKDSHVAYVYYRCVDSESRQNRAAAIAIADPIQKPKNKRSKAHQGEAYLTTIDFVLPKCAKQ